MRPVPSLAFVVLALSLAPTSAAHLAAPLPVSTSRSPVRFVAPVDAPVIDPFRAPPTPYAAGNRGLEYATTAGLPVRAAAGGVVTFAGQVGGVLDVVVLHTDAIRTTYGGLASIAVHAGDTVQAGSVVGTSGAGLHFGARAGRAYVDPAILLAADPGRPRLLPVEP